MFLMNPASMWESAEVVERFAARPPDRRLLALFAGEGPYADVLREWAPPASPRVLDIGCAGGRNTVWLARWGADVWAVDASAAMVAKTRELLSEVLGTQEATRRVRVGEMRDLRPEADASFDLVLALGVFQDAQDSAEWHATLAEAARVLRVGGLCLVANFGPGSQPAGRPLTPVPGERDVWQGYGSEDRRMTLPKPEDLDADFARHGLKTVLQTERVHVKTARGYHFTLNALYLRE